MHFSWLTGTSIMWPWSESDANTVLADWGQKRPHVGTTRPLGRTRPLSLLLQNWALLCLSQDTPIPTQERAQAHSGPAGEETGALSHLPGMARGVFLPSVLSRLCLLR